MPFDIAMPQLVTIEGDDDEEEDYSFLGSDTISVAELLGIEYPDAAILTENAEMTPRQLQYLNMKYPEYMGIWPIIAAAGKALIGAIPKGIKAIKKAVNKKKKKKADAKTAATKKAEEQKALAAAVEQKRIEELQKAEEKKKMMITMIVPAAALLLFMVMKKK